MSVPRPTPERRIEQILLNIARAVAVLVDDHDVIVPDLSVTVRGVTVSLSAKRLPRKKTP